ncbi:MAG: aminotransferase class I/II-fold pyridoxal phosphate-dependent enzyme [Acidobacteria bacterium]|nr:aminotransferase class I/II-fold pyridoxal phosphate-dependent enzyme [Acidobacteriota bacterium]
MRPPLTARLAPFGTSVFAEMTALAHRHNALNLGQGFPDFDGPVFVMEAAIEAMKAGHNQYAPMPGVPGLRRAIAEHQRRFYGLEHDPDAGITVHAGATGALCATLQALLDPGDEVILFEPFYDAYRPGISLAGARERVVPLVPPGFTFDPAALEATVGPTTRLLLLNSPNNPAGKVFSRPELETIAGLCVRHDLLAVTDEVYEHIVFEGEHIPLATLPGMRERTVTISSAGKTFSLTGWKIGWTCAAPPLAAAVRAAHQFVTYAVATPFQHAMARALGAPDDYYDGLREGYRARRDRLCQGLADIGFQVEAPPGTYFANADIRPLGFDDDVAFCRMLPERVGVAAVPLSAFLLEGGPRHMVRFAFAKDEATLDDAVHRLRGLRP